VRVDGSGFGPHLIVRLDGSPGAAQTIGGIVYLTAPSSPVGSTFVVSIANPEGCTAPTTVPLQISSPPPPSCGLLGIESLVALVPAFWQRARRRRTG
jgi:hypothetical protein